MTAVTCRRLCLWARMLIRAVSAQIPDFRGYAFHIYLPRMSRLKSRLSFLFFSLLDDRPYHRFVALPSLSPYHRLPPYRLMSRPWLNLVDATAAQAQPVFHLGCSRQGPVFHLWLLSSRRLGEPRFHPCLPSRRGEPPGESFVPKNSLGPNGSRPTSTIHRPSHHYITL